MDPKATLKLFLLALLAGSRADAIEHAENLLNWFRRGGFIPQLDAQFFIDIVLAAAWPWHLIHRYEFGETYHPFWFRATTGREGRFPDIYKIHPELLAAGFDPKNDEQLRLESLPGREVKLFEGAEFGAAVLIDEIDPEDPDPEEDDH